jgi:S-adenosylmethionine decarboxylase proenzyme
MVLVAPVGVHLLLNVYNVHDRGLLERLESGRPRLNELIHDLDLHVVAEAGHQFLPVGYTYAYVLSESHFTIHTYPEYHSCYIDLFCCSPSFQPLQAIEYIKSLFHTENVSHKIVRR